MAGNIHVIGAGLAGLAASVRLAGSASVTLHEATAHAGGRCRSYLDHATGMMIDNGNHLLLSANRAALSYLRTLGTEGKLGGPATAEFPFADLRTGERWTLRINDGRLPWWIFDARRRVPGTRVTDYLRLAPLLWARDDTSICRHTRCAGPLYDRLLRPLLLAALNIDPPEGSARLAGQVLRESLAAGGKACRPLIARQGLGEVFVEPAIEFLRNRNVAIGLRRELRGLTFRDGAVAELDFGDDRVALAPRDVVILAVPPNVAALLVPDLKAPNSFRAIVNAHFRIDAPTDVAAMIGVLNATTEWIFAFPGRLAVTISNADRLLEMPRETLATTIWGEVAAITGIEAAMPAWQIVRERRATFAATPGENARRPGPRTAWRNLFLAGDWTDTGLPATIEGAIRSGNRAAELAMQGSNS
jgi:squalene-associated FAD-dependent desaturase